MSKYYPLYVRRGQKISGPFPIGQISQSILLGRISLADEVSIDKEEWQPIRAYPDLIPEVLKEDPSDDEVKERLRAAKRWADERRPSHGEDAEPRRVSEPYETIEYRQNRESVYSRLTKRREFSILQLLIVVSIMIGLIYLGFSYEPQSKIKDATCNAPANPGVNWSNCRMAGLQSIRSNLQGAMLDSAVLSGANLFGSNLSNAGIKYADLSLANLSYVDFSNASLKGASLQNADLTQANLQRADLSYADLTGAKIGNINLVAARLDNTIWIDGRVCLSGSTGECKTLTK